jgi:hypothetical protein
MLRTWGGLDWISARHHGEGKLDSPVAGLLWPGQRVPATRGSDGYSRVGRSMWGEVHSGACRLLW